MAIAEKSAVSQKPLWLLAGVGSGLLLHTLAGFLGPLGALVNLILPFPAAYVHMRAGTLVGIGTVALTILGLLGIGGDGSAVGYALQFGIGAVLLPLLLRRGWAWDRAAGATTMVVFCAAMLALAGFATYQGETVNSLVQQYVQGEVERALVIYKSAELPEGQVAELGKVANQMAEFLMVTYPGLIVTATALLQLVTLGLLVSRSRGKYLVAGRSFATWKAPDVLVWLLILAGFALFFSAGIGQLIATNLLVVLLPTYFLQGLAVVTFFFQKKAISPGFRALGYVLVAFLNPLPMIVTGIGVFDLWADFRKPRIKKT